MTDNYATVAGPDSLVNVVARAVLRKWPSLRGAWMPPLPFRALRAAPPLDPT